MSEKESEVKVKDIILKNFEEGKIVIATVDGLSSMDIVDFIEQPVEGLLYDLNRDEVTCLTFIEKGEPVWINNFATCKVIKALKSKIDNLKIDLQYCNMILEKNNIPSQFFLENLNDKE